MKQKKIFCIVGKTRNEKENIPKIQFVVALDTYDMFVMPQID